MIQRVLIPIDTFTLLAADLARATDSLRLAIEGLSHVEGSVLDALGNTLHYVHRLEQTLQICLEESR